MLTLLHCSMILFTAQTALLDGLLPYLCRHYERDFRAADAAYRHVKVATTQKAWQTRWRHWRAYVEPLGVDPELQGTNYQTRIRCISGLAMHIRSGYFDRRKQVQADKVSGAFTAVGQTIVLVHETNLTKATDSGKPAPRLQQMLDDWQKQDPNTKKKLPAEANVLEFLVNRGHEYGATA